MSNGSVATETNRLSSKDQIKREADFLSCSKSGFPEEIIIVDTAKSKNEADLWYSKLDRLHLNRVIVFRSLEVILLTSRRNGEECNNTCMLLQLMLGEETSTCRLYSVYTVTFVAMVIEGA